MKASEEDLNFGRDGPRVVKLPVVVPKHNCTIGLRHRTKMGLPPGHFRRRGIG